MVVLGEIIGIYDNNDGIMIEHMYLCIRVSEHGVHIIPSSNIMRETGKRQLTSGLTGAH